MPEDLIANQRGESTRPTYDAQREKLRMELVDLSGKVGLGYATMREIERHRVLKEAFDAADARAQQAQQAEPAPFPVSDGKETDRNMARTAMQEKLRDAQERAMRLIDEMGEANTEGETINFVYGFEALMLARTKLREAFMWAEEACFPAPRRTLGDD